MGFLDFFGREPRVKSDRIDNRAMENLNPAKNQPAPYAVFKPTAFSDVETIIDQLKIGKTVVVHLSGLKNDTAIRILDMLSGAVYALNGGVYEMESNIFMFAPTGVEIL